MYFMSVCILRLGCAPSKLSVPSQWLASESDSDLASALEMMIVVAMMEL